MNTQEFLSTILPASGHYCLAHPYTLDSGKTVFKHFTTDNIGQLNLAASIWCQQGLNVYFSVCSLAEPYTIDAKTKKKRVRTKDNVASIKAIFLDVDVLKPHEVETATESQLKNKYTSRKEALVATKEFCKAVGWPLPMVVDSGWGFHLYWCLSEEIDSQQFESLMLKLKAVAQHTQYKLDAACTDTTRVLRVVGTKNYKTQGDDRDVTVLRDQKERFYFAELQASVEAYIAKHEINFTAPPSRESIPPYLDFGDTNTSDFINEPLNLRPMLTKCGALKDFVEAKGDVGYHHWMHSLQVLRFCNRGRELAHRISSGADSYSEADTDKILDSLEEKDIPPTLCETMAGSASACETCPLRGKIRTPATLGREHKLKQQITQQQVTAAGALPPAPWPYKNDSGGGVCKGHVEDGITTWETIYKYNITPIRRVFSEREQSEHVLWQTSNPADGTFELDMPSAALYERRAFLKVLAEAGMYVDLHHADDLRMYMISYTQEIQTLYAKEIMYMQMGWRDDGSFVYKRDLFKPDGVVPCETERSGRVVDALTKQGSLEGWKEIIGMFEHEDFAGHQFGIATAFGAPLMRFTGLNGGIINMMGRSGEGKSTVQKIVNSVWGHPIKLMLPAEARASTYNAKISFINQMNSLPICAEEITNTSPEDIGSLAYAITQGSEKWRADIKGGIREAQGGWCTTLLSSANGSLHEKLHSLEGGVAKALRVFEYHLNHVKVHTPSEFRRAVDIPILDNYGHAGAIYAEYITQNADDIKQRLKDKWLAIDNTYEFAPEERVWSSLIATNLVGLEIANELGLTNFNIAAIERFVHRQVSQVRDAVTDIDMPSVDALSNFLTQNVSNMLIVESANDKKNTFVLTKPSQKLYIRYDTNSKGLLINISALREWTNANGLSYNTMISDLQEQGLVLARSRRETLGKGTDIPSGQSRVLVVDAQSPAFMSTLRNAATLGVQPNVGVYNA